jgi:ATP-dependent DNA helicase RecG
MLIEGLERQIKPFREALEKLELLRDGKLTNAAILLFGKIRNVFSSNQKQGVQDKGIKPLEFIDMKVFGGAIID